jgi:TonB family protein
VREAGFGDADASTLQPHSKSVAQTAPRIFPAEIVFKPLPTYTAEARKLRLEGEVLLEVVFGASGQLRVVRVVQGLGHGLDDAAIQAAERIRFKPALRDGRPTDFTAVLHVIFQLA